MKIKLDATDKIFEAASLLCLIGTVAILVFSIPGLPDTVPVHFNLNGEPNRYGSKNTLWAVIAISVFLYMLTGILSMFPQSFNYPSQKNDKEAQYKLGARFMRSLRAWILFFIMILSFIVVRSAKTGTAKGAVWLIAFVLAIVAGHLIYFFTKWKKIK